MSGANPFAGVVIAGIFNTEQARQIAGHDTISIIAEAIHGALADAGISPTEVDGVGASFIEPQYYANRIVTLLGGRPSWVSGIGRSGIGLVADAALAIKAGLASTVVVASGFAGFTYDRGATPLWTRPTEEFTECWGLYTAAEYALVASRQRYLYGVTEEQAATVAATIRNNGHRTPGAVHYGKPMLTVEDVLQSRMIAEPLHLLDCCIANEGGGALILTTAERARDLDVTPIHIAGLGLESIGQGYNVPAVWEQCGSLGAWAADKAFGMAGLSRDDVDVFELYDPTSYEVIRQFEALGFCKPGEGGDLVMEGRIESTGSHPVCTDGGTMAHSHPGVAQLIMKVNAGVRQLQGRAPANQVGGAKVAIIANAGSASLANDVLLLSAEEV